MKEYLITDPYYCGNTQESLRTALKKSFALHQPSYVCYRHKEYSKYKERSYDFVQICQENKIENIILHQDYELASELKVEGVHLTSLQLTSISQAKALGLKVIVSCHTQEDIEKAIKLQAHAVTYSPIFKSPNKGETKGIQNLIDICKTYKIKVFALGGIISKKEIEEIKKSKAYGFASIRYFFN